MKNLCENVIMCIIRSGVAVFMAYLLYSYAGQRLKLDYAAMGYSPIEAACAIDSKDLAQRKMCIEVYNNYGRTAK